MFYSVGLVLPAATLERIRCFLGTILENRPLAPMTRLRLSATAVVVQSPKKQPHLEEPGSKTPALGSRRSACSTQRLGVGAAPPTASNRSLNGGPVFASAIFCSAAVIGRRPHRRGTISLNARRWRGRETVPEMASTPSLPTSAFGVSAVAPIGSSSRVAQLRFPS